MLAILKPVGERLVASFRATFTTHSAEDFQRFRQFREAANTLPQRLERAELDAPTRSEAAFTRALQARQYDAAWQMLAPAAQRAWQDRRSFATEMAANRSARIERSKLKAIQLLPRWQDPVDGQVHERVAELQVEYHIRHHDRRFSVEKVLHLVRVDGDWKNLVYPSAPLLRSA